jgi:hypothetical protein
MWSTTAGKIYWNGELVQSGAASVANTTQYNMHLGYRTNNSSDYFEGYMRDVRVYFEELTAEQIYRIYRGWE